MMTAVREWLLSLVCTAMLISAAERMAPEGGMRKLVSMTGGLILLVMLMRPVVRMDTDVLKADYGGYLLAVERRQEELAKEQDAQLRQLIEHKTAAYISDKAGQLGLDCSVEVRCAAEEDGIPYPWSAEIFGETSKELESWMERELDIPAERQVVHGREQ